MSELSCSSLFFSPGLTWIVESRVENFQQKKIFRFDDDHHKSPQGLPFTRVQRPQTTCSSFSPPIVVFVFTLGLLLISFLRQKKNCMMGKKKATPSFPHFSVPPHFPDEPPPIFPRTISPPHNQHISSHWNDTIKHYPMNNEKTKNCKSA